MARDIRSEVEQAIREIACTLVEGKDKLHKTKDKWSITKELSAEELSNRVIQSIRKSKIGDGFQGSSDDTEPPKVDTPEFWKWAGRSYFKLLLSDLLQKDLESFHVHLGCYRRK